MKEIRDLIRQTLNEFVSFRDLKDVENYADGIFSDVHIDVEFTKHFLDRVNDPRNGIEITPEELKLLYKKTREKYGEMLSQLKPGTERVVNDTQTNINIPVAINWDGKSNELDMIAKTVMRKKNFLTSPDSPKLTLEEIDEDILGRMSDFGMSEYDIDRDGYITLYHGGVQLPNRLNPDEIFFMAPNYETAENYAQIRGKQNNTEGEVFTIKVKPEDVSWNTGSGEIEFDKGGLISNRNGYNTIIPKTNEDINVPINVGDTVLGGKFKNKKIIVKDIDKNEKGDITINDKPLLKVRVVKESEALSEAIKTACQTKDAVYNIDISDNSIDIKIKLPFDLDINEKEAKTLEANLHNLIEIALAKYFK